MELLQTLRRNPKATSIFEISGILNDSIATQPCGEPASRALAPSLINKADENAKRTNPRLRIVAWLNVMIHLKAHGTSMYTDARC